LNHIQRYTEEIHLLAHKRTIDVTHIHHLLSQLVDIPKLVSAILYKKINPSLFVRLRATLRFFFEETNSPLLGELFALDLEQKVATDVEKLFLFLRDLIKSDEEYHEDIDFIRDRYNSHIDDLRKIAYHSDEMLLTYQQELAKVT
jgi:DNA mismatch repair ATPase MutS